MDWVTFTEEILNGKLHFLRSDELPNNLRLRIVGNEEILEKPQNRVQVSHCREATRAFNF